MPKGWFPYAGWVGGGSASVDDSFSNSDSGLSGTLRYHGPLRRTPPSFTSATMLVNSTACTYVLSIGFNIRATFSGTTASPGRAAGGTVYSPRSPVPRNLRLNGTSAVPVSDSCSSKRSLFANAPCYEPAGGWTSDYLMLKRCRSTIAGNCGEPNRALGVAAFAWHLKPH